MGIVSKRNTENSADFDYNYKPSKYVFPPDTPEVEEQEPPIYNFKDNGKNPPLKDPKSNLYLENPSNIKTNVEYNPETGNYDIKQKIGDINYRPETYMDLKEYKDYMFKKQMAEYWRSRFAADAENENPRKGMIPKLQVNSELFDRIFGGNTVDIKPTGTAELMFGLNHNRNMNPAIPQRQQKITNFDFDMKIQLNLIGKIGEKLKVNFNYNTEASFDWENQVKVDYTGLEDEIIKKIEAGNVTLPLNSSLISGSQTLFGFKTDLQFGKLKAAIVLSQQRGKKQEVTVQGGAQTTPFNISADNYEQNRHFFLGHYFRKNYDRWMTTLPVISTPVVITKVEVYVLGMSGTAEQTRNIVAFEDLGEGDFGTGDLKNMDSVYVHPYMTSGIEPAEYTITDNDPTSDIPYNNANSLYKILVGTGDSSSSTSAGLISGRNFNDLIILASNVLPKNANNDGGNYMQEGRDYVKIQNARRLNASEFTFNPRTGYISLTQALNNEQALAVSYQYTYGNKTYQVGEFSENVPDNSKLLICKLLKSNTVSVRHPMWRLMMKNVYNIGAYNLSPQDFQLNIFYNNTETGVDIPYLPYGNINGIQLLRVLNCDNLSVNGDKYPDGYFDFINGYTVLTTNGRIYFPTTEPFGRGLQAKFAPEDFPTANRYIYRELYDSTKTAASFLTEKNRFKIKGNFRSSSGSEISLNALNIPQGAVVVTANGVALVENTDYTVDYTLGRVKIINEGILNSGATIKVSLESNSLFNVQQKNLMGTRLDYKAGRNLSLGSTILRYNERPLTQKVSLGDEPVDNWIIGLDYNYKTDIPFLTRLLDKLPFYSTKEMSSISTRGEFARLFPGNAKAISKSGNSYIDDYEGSLNTIDLRSTSSWVLASIPQGQPGLFPEAAESNNIYPGINRARFNWYNIDAMFTRDQNGKTPNYYNSKKLFSNNMWRQVFETELFPGKTPPNGQQVVLPVLDLGFYPNERGPYNYDVNGTKYSRGVDFDGNLNDPKTRWGGIMRRMETNDFQAANIEYIQFWLMDPYNEDYNLETDSAFDRSTGLPEGDLFFNLGNISEDIVKDERMSYENGLRGNSNITKDAQVDTTNLAIVPLLPPTINAFSQDENDRAFQDVGYDGMNDESERWRFQDVVNDMMNGNFSQAAKDKFYNDPSSDKFHFFRGNDYDNIQANTLRRYSLYNNPENNSPTASSTTDGYSPSYMVTTPNIEDVNRDNTLNTAENYYQYRVHISPTDVSPSAVGTNFLVDAFDGTAEFSGVTKKVKWYQFKIPIREFENAYGGIEGFNSIRFMRVYMKGFQKAVLLRLARFELVRSDWRPYAYDLTRRGEYIAIDDNGTSFGVSAVSLQENGNKVPVNYVMPPDIEQVQNVQTTNLVLQNEQALAMNVCNLRDGDSRAVFKNVDLDSRMYKNIKMNVHAEAIPGQPLNDDDLHFFFRVGTDYNDNYYEYEIPLKLTPKGYYDNNSSADRYIVWPSQNEVNFKFDDISIVKDERNRTVGYYSNLNALSTPFSKDFGGYTVTIVGNPNLGTIKSVMAGIRNPQTQDKLARCVEVWINELRLTDFNNQGGWATTGQVQAKLADLGMVSLAGTYKTPYWGSVEQKINERSRQTDAIWDASTNLNVGKFFPESWKISLPMYYNYGQTIITPLYNPLDPDVLMSAVKNNTAISNSQKDDISRQVKDFTERKGFNVSNVRIDGFKRKGAKPMPWDISNFSFTYAYNEIFRRNVNIDYNTNRQYRANLQYAYSLKKPPVFAPFKNSKALKSKWFALIKDFNMQLLPNNFGFSTDFNRAYIANKNRDITSMYNGGANDFENPTLVNKNFTTSRAYNFSWNICKAIKFDYTANNDGRVLERLGEVNSNDKAWRDDVVNTFFNGTADTAYNRAHKDTTHKIMGKFGETTTYRQQMNLNVDLPLNKIPILDFVKTTYRYGGTYTWTRRPFANDTVGNIIQNTNTHNATASLDMMKLYNKIPYFKRVNTQKKTPGRTETGNSKDKNLTKPQVPTKGKSGKDTANEKNNNFKEIAEYFVRGLLMLKNVNLTFQQSGGQMLPNFKPSSQYGGMDFSPNMHQAPGFLFTTGLHDDNIRQRSVDNNWLTQNKTQTTPYTETWTRNYSYQANIEPHGSIKVQLTGNYTKSKNITEYTVYDDINKRFDFKVSPYETGNFSMSTMTFMRAFKDGNKPSESNLFNEFRSERFNVATELAAQNDSSNKYVHSVNYPDYIDGYSVNQQDVLLGAFYNVYTGRKIKNYSTKNIFPTIPLPNWNVTWDGLGKIKAFKKLFKGITVQHGYRSTYNIAGYTNNLLFNPDGEKQDQRMPVDPGGDGNRNFVPYYTINAVTLSEQFAPLIKFSFQFNKPGWSANTEVKRDKTTSLNFTSFQIIETKGQEYVVGLGYMYPKLKIKKITIQGKPLESNLTVKVDISYRKNISVIRNITYGNTDITAGTNIFTMRSSADYMLTQNVTLRLYYDWIRTTPQTSTSFPTGNVNAGISLRITFQ